jgi:hypothetical protein
MRVAEDRGRIESSIYLAALKLLQRSTKHSSFALSTVT